MGSSGPSLDGRTGQVNHGCVSCLSRCPWIYILCDAADPDRSLCLYEMDTVYIQRAFFICRDMEETRWLWLFPGLGLGELQAQRSTVKGWAGCH